MPRELKMPTAGGPGRRFGVGIAPKLPRSVFNLSHPFKCTMDAGYLIPILVVPVIPGDTFACKATIFARLTTPVRPVQDNLYGETFFFYVPNRQVWDNFVKMMGEQVNPGDSISFVVPSLTVPFTPSTGSLSDYFGVMPQAVGGAIQTPNTISCLPYRMYSHIYNTWFRDENLINSLNVNKTDGPDASGNAQPQKRGKRHDYFTSCLPFVQKGTAAAAAVSGLAGVTPTFVTSGGSNVLNLVAPGADLGNVTGDYTSGAPAAAAMQWVNPALQVLVNDLRLSLAIQTLLERDARGGTRYTEIVREHFGVESDDQRLQRPQYLGGGSTPVVVSPIAQTAPVTAAPVPPLVAGTHVLGQLGGYGTLTAFNHGFHGSFKEHGYIIGLLNFRADLTYQQGVNRDWFKQTRYDFFWPELAFIGEQAVLNQEIWFQGTTAANGTDRAAFGYMPRYDEYRYMPGRIAGLYRSNAAGTVDFWHLSEDFAALPTLGQTFIEDQTSSVLTRVLAVPAEPDFYVDIWFDIKAARPIPTYGIPGWGSRPF